MGEDSLSNCLCSRCHGERTKSTIAGLEKQRRSLEDSCDALEQQLAERDATIAAMRSQENGVDPNWSVERELQKAADFEARIRADEREKSLERILGQTKGVISQKYDYVWNEAIEACARAIECECSCAGYAQAQIRKLKRNVDTPTPTVNHDTETK